MQRQAIGNRGRGEIGEGEVRDLALIFAAIVLAYGLAAAFLTPRLGAPVLTELKYDMGPLQIKKNLLQAKKNIP